MSLRIRISSDQSEPGPIHHGSYSVKNRVAYNSNNNSNTSSSNSNIILWCNSSSNNIGYGISKIGNNSKWMQQVVLCPCRPRLHLSPPEWLRLILRVFTCIMAVSIISGIQLTSAHLRLYNYKGNSSGCINSNTIFNNNSNSSKWSTTIYPLGLLSQALVAPNASRANVIPNNSQWVTRLIHLLLHLLCEVRCINSSSHSLTPPLYVTDHRCDTTTINYAIFSKRAYEKFGFFCLLFSFASFALNCDSALCLTTKMLFALLMLLQLKCIKVTSNSGSLMTNSSSRNNISYRIGIEGEGKTKCICDESPLLDNYSPPFFVLLIYLTTCTKNWWALLCCDYFVSCFWIIIQQLWIYHIISTALNIQLYTFMMMIKKTRNVLITSIIAHMKYKKEWKIISVFVNFNGWE